MASPPSFSLSFTHRHSHTFGRCRAPPPRTPSHWAPASHSPPPACTGTCRQVQHVLCLEGEAWGHMHGGLQHAGYLKGPWSCWLRGAVHSPHAQGRVSERGHALQCCLMRGAKRSGQEWAPQRAWPHLQALLNALVDAALRAQERLHAHAQLACLCEHLSASMVCMAGMACEVCE